MATRSSDTPENENEEREKLLPHDSPDLLRGPQGLIDWEREEKSDERLSLDASRRLFERRSAEE